MQNETPQEPAAAPREGVGLLALALCLCALSSPAPAVFLSPPLPWEALDYVVCRVFHGEPPQTADGRLRGARDVLSLAGGREGVEELPAELWPHLSNELCNAGATYSEHRPGFHLRFHQPSPSFSSAEGDKQLSSQNVHQLLLYSEK